MNEERTGSVTASGTYPWPFVTQIQFVFNKSIVSEKKIVFP